MLKPTPELRFVERETRIHNHKNYDGGTSSTFIKVKILQQWWGDFSVDMDSNHLVEFVGEWRDVPLENE